MSRIEALHSENKQDFQNLIHRIDRRFEDMSLTQKMLAYEANSASRHDELTKMLQALVLASPSTTSSQMQSKTKHSALIPQFAATKRQKCTLEACEPQTGPRKRNQQEDCAFPVPMKPQNQTQTTWKTHSRAVQQTSYENAYQSPASTEMSTAADEMLNCARQFVSDWLLVLFVMSLTTVYQTASLRRVVIAQLHAAQQDPLLAALLSSIVVALLRRVVQLPRLITSLDDNSISLQTALGEDLVIPRVYWESREVLHGFLASHFHDRPGRLWVVQKSYRILLGGSTGVVIDDSKWSKVITRKMKLTMAMLLDRQHTCPKCNSELAPQASPEAMW